MHLYYCTNSQKVHTMTTVHGNLSYRCYFYSYCHVSTVIPGPWPLSELWEDLGLTVSALNEHRITIQNG